MNLINDEKHYNTLNNYYRKIFNKKVAKISLNANFTCPNKDGVKGYGGCSFCSRLGSGDFAGDVNLSFKEQFEQVKLIMNKKWSDTLYIPFLQANSNTYASLDKLKEIYNEILELDENIVMLSIATRPDCLDKEKINYLSILNKKIPVQIELGLQTMHDSTASSFNRGYLLEEFDATVTLLRKNNIEVVVHIINGLENETKSMMLDTIKYLNKKDIQGIKIHNLAIISNTKMGNDFINKPFKMLSLEEYVDIVCDQIGLLNKNIIIHRLTCDAKKEDLISPTWSLKKLVVVNEIDKRLRSLKLYQGDLQ
ncbi:MAG: TIGR01212 family radical SAM protein [Anaeroplasmataceae bacterium]